MCGNHSCSKGQWRIVLGGDMTSVPLDPIFLYQGKTQKGSNNFSLFMLAGSDSNSTQKS